jgi:hypothetical protein
MTGYIHNPSLSDRDGEAGGAEERSASEDLAALLFSGRLTEQGWDWREPEGAQDSSSYLGTSAGLG